MQPETSIAAPKARAFLAGRRQLGWICLGGLASAGLRGVHVNHRLGSLLLDPYWVGFYVTNFQDGFRRRALLGTLFRLVQPGGVSVFWINLLAISALAVLLALFTRAILRLVGPQSTQACVLLFAFFASALASILFEVLGDTLQIALLVFAACTLLPARWVQSYPLRLSLGVAGVLVAFFIHEASVFLLAPCLPFFVSEKLKLRDVLVSLLLLGVLVALSVHWSSLSTHLTYHAQSVPRGLPLEDLAVTPNLLALFRQEVANDFSTQLKLFFFVIRCASLCSLAFAGLVALAKNMKSKDFKRFLAALLTILILSAPLWVIAHDWGRFLSYSFVLAALAASTRNDFSWLTSREWLTALTLGFQRVARNPAFQCAALLLLLSSPYYQSRIAGMHIRDFLSALLILWIGVTQITQDG